MSGAPKYDEEFRQMAVKLALESDNVSAVARQLGLPHWRLNNWVVVHKKRVARGEASVVNKELKAKLDAKDKEIERLRLENEILKKAAAYFAKEAK